MNVSPSLSHIINIQKTVKFFILTVCFSAFMRANGQNSIPQPTTNSYNDYFYVRQQVESSGTLNASTDTGEGGVANAYARWRWFWDTRNTNAGKLNSNNMQALGDMSEYLSLLLRYSNASSQSNLRYNSNSIVANDFSWQNINNTESVFSLGTQTGGRIDVIKANPQNHNEVYAGTPTSGLWRCKDISQAQPVWENITDNIGISYLGVMGLAINPNGTEAVMLVGCNTFYYTSLGIGVFYTTDITATPVIWNNISTGITDLDLANTTSIPHYKFLDIYYNDSGLGVYQYYFMTDNALYGIVNGNISKISDVKTELNNFTGGNVLLRSFIYDKSNYGLFYISALQDIGNNLYQPKLFALSFLGLPPIADLTAILPNIVNSVSDGGYNRPIIFSYGQNGIYTLYLKNNSHRNIVNLTTQQAYTYDISATSAVFYVSNVNDNIFYTESNGRQIQKSIGNSNLLYKPVVHYDLE